MHHTEQRHPPRAWQIQRAEIWQKSTKGNKQERRATVRRQGRTSYFLCCWSDPSPSTWEENAALWQTRTKVDSRHKCFLRSSVSHHWKTTQWNRRRAERDTEPKKSIFTWQSNFSSTRNTVNRNRISLSEVKKKKRKITLCLRTSFQQVIFSSLANIIKHLT